LRDEQGTATELSLSHPFCRDRIYRFSLQLDLMMTASWEVPIAAIDTCLAKGQSERNCRNFIMSVHTFNNRLFVCGSFAFSPYCTWRKTDTLELIKEERGLSPFNPRSNVTTLVMDDGKMFIGSTIDFSGSDSVIARIPLRTDLSMDSSKILRTKQYNNLELNNPQFVGSFEHGEFVYFVFREESIEMASFGMKAIYSRIGRVCKNDSGGFHIYKDNWTSFLKARLVREVLLLCIANGRFFIVPISFRIVR
jgi:semaphorin 5